MEKKHSNPYLEHIGSQQKLFEPMIPTRPIRDVNNHSKVIYIDETRERIQIKSYKHNRKSLLSYRLIRFRMMRGNPQKLYEFCI